MSWQPVVVMTFGQRLNYAVLSLRAWRFLLAHPFFGSKLLLKRLAFTVTRRFVGDTLVAPGGDIIFNTQSLINGWAMHAVRELGDNWCHRFRETIAPLVFDVGANIGQFGRLVKQMNPGARVVSFEPQPGMDRYHAYSTDFKQIALGPDENSFLTLANGPGWTASTHSGFYPSQSRPVSATTLDRVWTIMGQPTIDLLKIDVDGGEFFVLRGAAKALKSTRMMIIDVNSEPRWLRHIGLPEGFHWSTVNGHDWIGIRYSV